VTPAGAWWCEQFPTGRTTASLVQPFRGNVQRFITHLEQERGCTVHIAATRRPAARAFLMHWAWMIAREGFDPARVPVGGVLMAGGADGSPGIPTGTLGIVWTVEGAREMVATYGLVHKPSLTSRHIQGRAIDMRIDGWPRESGNESLYELGATFGVIKLRSDPPHWSDDGR
jgi:hypothetical protein